MTTTMTDLRDGRTYVFNEALPGRDAYEDALAQGFEGTRAAWLASLRGFAFDPASADWEVDRPYAVNAAIRHQHKIWVAKLAHEGVTPGTDPEVWQLLLDGASALELSNAVAAALAHQGAAETAAGLAEAKRAAAAAILNATLDAAAALTPIDALHPVSLPIPAGWWDTGDRLLSGASERAIICNWAHETLAPAALWRGTLPASLRATTDGASTAAVGGTVARINDNSGNGLHLTQASNSLRPIRGRRPKSGIRNLLLHTENWAEPYWATGWTKTPGQPDPEGGTGAVRIDYTTAGQVVGSFSSPTAAVTMSVAFKLVTLGATTALNFIIRNFSTSTNLVSGVLNPGTMTFTTAAPGATAAITALGDGWYQLKLTATLGISPGDSMQVQLGSSGAASGLQYLLWHPQAEAGQTATAYQCVGASHFDVTEPGIEAVAYAGFDLLDDALTTGPIAGGLTGQAFVAGDGGCWVADLAIPVAGSFTIGGTAHAWTGATPGILRAVTGGTGRVLEAMIRAGTFSATELGTLERFYRAKGAKGLLVPTGPELIVNGTFAADLAGWAKINPETILTHVGGAIRVQGAAGIYGRAYQAIPTVIGGWYRLTLGASPGPGSAGIFYLGQSPGGLGIGIFYAVAGGAVFRATAATTYLTLYSSGVSGDFWTDYDNVSMHRLLPREEL